MKTEIYLIRHAEPLKCDMKNEDIPLSSSGEKQAKLLSELVELKDLDLVFSSEYKRAIMTANKLSDNVIIDSCFNERKMGTEEKDKSFWLEQLYDENAKCIDGESRKEVRDRMLSGINKILDSNKKRCAIVTHAAAITFLLMNYCNLDRAELEGKKRRLSFNGKIVIDGSFGTPEVFKLTFINKIINSIELINIKSKN